MPAGVPRCCSHALWALGCVQAPTCPAPTRPLALLQGGSSPPARLPALASAASGHPEALLS